MITGITGKLLHVQKLALTGPTMTQASVSALQETRKISHLTTIQKFAPILAQIPALRHLQLSTDSWRDLEKMRNAARKQGLSTGRQGLNTFVLNNQGWRSPYKEDPAVVVNAIAEHCTSLSTIRLLGRYDTRDCEVDLAEGATKKQMKIGKQMAPQRDYDALKYFSCQTATAP